MRGHRLWLKIAVHGTFIPVYVTNGPVVGDDGVSELDAYYDHETPCIVVLSRDNVGAMKQALHHELLHVCFSAVSGDVREGLFKSKSSAGRAKREEELVSFLEPVQFDLLVRNGWLRYPNPPKAKQ